MKNSSVRALALMLCSVAAGNAGEVPEIDGGYSGAWYNPEQSGHGVFLEILDNNQAFAAWFVFDEAGNPFWVVGTGTVAGNVIELDAQALSGSAFPPAFDPDVVERRDWGSLTLEFESCTQGVLSWNAVEPQFGAGQLAVSRLTSIQGRACGETVRHLADLEVMDQNLRALHPEPFHSISESIFETRLSSLRDRIPGLPEAQLPAAFAELLATVADAHTGVALPTAGLSRLPLAFTRVREGLLVTQATPAYSNLLGMTLVSVEGTSAQSVEQRLASLIAHENDAWVAAQVPRYVVLPEALAYLGIVADPEEVTLRLAGDAGEMRVALPALASDASVSWRSVFDQAGNTKPLYLTRDDNYWFEYLEASRTLYIMYRRAQQIPGYSVGEFGEDLESFILSNQVDRLVIDLRLNGGGVSGLLDRFIRGLPNSPYDDPERLFVLIGNATFSAAVYDAVQFMSLTRATFIGQPTGGKPDSFGEPLTLELPGSGLPVRYSTRRIEAIGDDSILSVFPDITIELASREAFLRGEDPFLEAAIQ